VPVRPNIVACKSWTRIASKNVGMIHTRLPTPTSSSSRDERDHATSAAAEVPAEVPKTIETNTNSNEATAGPATPVQIAASAAGGGGSEAASV
jgi:hypothetical protein